MRRSALVTLLTALPALAALAPGAAAGGEIRMIDATRLSVAELMALAAAERENAGREMCCDWGGGGCQPHVARQAAGLTGAPRIKPAAPLSTALSGTEPPQAVSEKR